MAIFYTDTASIDNLQITGSSIISGSEIISGTLNVTSGITGSLLGTASWAVNVISASAYVQNSQTGGFATTGSNTFRNSQIISGSLTITNDLTVLGSSSIQYLSSSQLNIGTNLITVAVNSPSVRFGGLAVIDSGSSPAGSGSLLYDSETDEFIFIHKGVSGQVTSSVFLQGPETNNSVGNETYLTRNRIPKGNGNEHLNDSNISDNGSVVSINSNTQITGSLIVSNGITGSISGSVFGYVANNQTASFVTNTQTSSFVTNAQTSSFVLEAETGSFVRNTQTSSFVTNSQTSSFVTNVQTSSFVTNIQTSSFVTNPQTASFARTGSNTFTGDQTISGSLFVSTSMNVANELRVTATGISLGNVRSDIHTITGSINVSGSLNVISITGSFSGSVFGYVPNNQTASFVTNAQTSSFVLEAETGSFVRNTQTSSFVVNNQTASFVTNAQTSSFVLEAETGSFAITGSNTFRGNQTISGSLFVSTSLNIFDNEFVVNSNGIKIGNLSTDTHRLTGSLNVSGSIVGTSSFATSASFAISASWAPGSLTGGSTLFIPIWQSNTQLSSSALYQTESNVIIGAGALGSVRQSKLTVVGGVHLGGSTDGLGLRIGDVLAVNTNISSSFTQSLIVVANSNTGTNGNPTTLAGDLLIQPRSDLPAGNNFATRFYFRGIERARFDENGLLVRSGSIITSGSLTVLSGMSVSGASAINGNTNVTGSLIVNNNLNVIGVANVTGSLTVTGSARISNALTASTGLFSSSINLISSSVLSVFGTGSTSPIFYVGGSQGELFSVTDSLSGSLFSVNNISGLPILEVVSDNTVKMGEWPAQLLVTSTRVITPSTAATSSVYSLPTASYDAVFVDYSIRSGSISKAGTLYTTFNGATTNTSDVGVSNGSVTGVSWLWQVSSGRLNLNVLSNATWTIKTAIRSI